MYKLDGGKLKMETNFNKNKTKTNEQYDVLRDKFIDEVIMKTIHDLPDSQKSMILPAVDSWFQGHSFKFLSEYSKTEVNIHLTNLILTKLRQLGCYFQFKMTSRGNEFRNGEGTIEIDWSHANPKLFLV